MHKENVLFLGTVLYLQIFVMDDVKINLTFLLVGKTGSGKSATGNNIAGQRLFKASPSGKSLTRNIQLVDSKHYGRKLTIVDSPGFIDTGLNPTEHLPAFFDSMGQAMRSSPQGFHTFLYVVRYNAKLTDEDKQTFHALSNCFGEDYFSKYGVLIFTFGDMYDPEEIGNKSFSEWIHSQDGVLKEIINKFGGRVVLFDNKSKDESKRKNQVDNLIKIVDQLSVQNSKYSPEYFHLTGHERDIYLLKDKLPRIKLEVGKEINLVMDKVTEIMSEDVHYQLIQLNSLEMKLKDLFRDIKQHDKDTGVLNEVLASIQKAIDSMQKTIDIVRNPPKHEMKNLKESNEIQVNRNNGLIGTVVSCAKYAISFLYNVIKNIFFRF